MSTKKIILIASIFLSILTAFRLLWLNHFTTPDFPHAKQGELDLRNWEPIKDYSIKLDGEWEFFPEQFLYEENKILHSYKKELIKVPGVWNNSTKSSNTYGFGSYRLRILVDPTKGKTYGLRIIDIDSASEVYVNGKLLSRSGIPAKDKQQYKPLNKPYTVYFSLENEKEIELVIQVANFDHPLFGGIVRSLKFGLEGPLKDDINFSTGIVIIACIIYMLHALYGFIMFLVGGRDKRVLYFSLMTICVILGTLIGERLLFEWIPFNFNWSIKTIFLTITAGGYFLLQCIRQQLPDFFSKWMTPYACLSGLLVILILVLPAISILKLMLFYIMVMLIPSFLAILVLFRSTKKIDKDNIFILLAVTAAIGSLIWFIIIWVFQIEMVSYPFDLLIAIICFATYWFKKYFRILNESQSLTEKLQEADRQKDEFLLTVAHEMKNPLHGILNISQAVTAREKGALKKKSIQDLELLYTVGRRMSFLLNDLLELQRFKENRIVIHPSNVSIYSVTEVVMGMLRSMTGGKSIKLINQIPKNFPDVRADENRVHQILFNLLYNAIKYSDEGEVSVSAIVQHEWAKISVQDSGRGIDATVISSIFEPYVQASTEIEGGFGLGLSICKQLVELHGGEIEVSSELGNGTVFTFSLKLSNKSTEIEALKAQEDQFVLQEIAVTHELNRKNEDASQMRYDVQSIRILVVDDDPINLKVMESIFEMERYDIYTTTSGEHALSMLHRRDWDIIVADVMMPQISGFELTSRIREQYSIFELPILLLTANNQVEATETGFRVGANDYVMKPVNAVELKSRVRSLTKLKRAVNEHLRMEAAWLQAQIKPHFIINTFNSIASLSRFDLDRMDNLIQELSTYIRFSIGFQNIDGLSPLTDELQLVRSYLYIQKERFKDRLSVVWEVDDHIQIDIPPLTIQPLVENAIHHGLMKQMVGGEVRIIIKDKVQFVDISVADNGIGMTEETVEQLLDGQLDERSGIGLRNTDRRLKQLFGSGLKIESHPGKGTKVSFTISKN